MRVRLEELEPRLAPASYAVDARLEVSRLDNSGDIAGGTHTVVFFESAVADYQILWHGLDVGTDAVLLDSGGDGLREMAAFLAGRHGLTSVGVVAHGAPGALALGTASLDEQSLVSYTRELGVVGSALGPGGELDLWSCDVAAGQGGASLVRDLTAATGASVAAAEHRIGSPNQGGSWQLDVLVAGARGEVPFSADSLEAFPQLLGTWSPAAPLATAREHHTATLLANGEVLVTGGINGGTALAGAELYDPGSNTWSSAGSMATARYDQTATLLQSGKVLVTGGINGGTALASAELYDPGSNAWSSAGSMATAREYYTATLLANSKVLVTGGSNGSSVLSSAELYDPASNTWSAAGSMATARYGPHTATLLSNDKVLVTGGGDGNTVFSSAELYDPGNNTWSAAASLASARTNHTATLLGNGKVLVTGGQTNGGGILPSAELYDPVSNTWSAAGSMATPRELHTATLLSNGQVLVAGGSTSTSSVLSADLYDPASNTWSAAGSMAMARYAQTATLLASGRVLVAGGFNGSAALASAELYDTRGPLPDLRGYDARPGNSSDYFHLEESSPFWGDSVNLHFNVANFGATPPIPETFNVAIFLSSDSIIDTADTQIASFTGLAIPNANHYTAYTVTIQLPASKPLGGTGPFYLGMIINPDNNVAESDKTNNSNLGDGIDRTTFSVPSQISVTDSVAPSNDHAVNFGSVVDDGPGNASAMQTVTITNTAAGSLLKILQNGIRVLNGTNFHIVSILSNKLSQAVNVAGGFSLIAPNSSETWTIQVAFDPMATGPLSDTLVIQSDDPVNPIVNVALSGTGVPEPNLVVVSPANQTVNFGNIAVNGAGTAAVTLTNNGSGPLTVKQNGIALPPGPFSISSITSSTQGSIDLSANPATIAATGTESWTLELKFLPTATGLFQLPLTITSNAPQDGTAIVSLLGTGQMAAHLIAPTGPLNFGSVAADGPSKQLVTQTITLSNTGQLPLQVKQSGITLATGAQFQIAAVVSSTQGAINVAAGPATIAGGGAETWTVTLQFDPSTAGALTDTLTILSSDPASPTTNIALTGTGLNQPTLFVTSSATPNNKNLTVNFPATLNDGPGGRSSTQTVQLSNVGTQPLVVPQNGIILANGTNFQVVSIVSSTGGAVNLASSKATLAPTSSETWTVTLRFDPVATGALSDTLSIASNDPLNPMAKVGLNGQGVVPAVTAGSPAQAIHVSAGRAYRITWSGTYAPGTGTYTVYYDTDRNPASGLVPIATGLPQSQTFYDWQVPTNLVGGTYSIYVTLQDGAVSAGSYGAGSLTIDTTGSDRLLSAPVTDQPGYVLSYIYNGTPNSAFFTLSVGDNALFPTVGGVAHEYHVTLVPTLVDSETSAYDQLGNVTSTTDSAGQATAVQYDQMSRPIHVAYADGTTVDYAYDPAGNLLTMHDASGWQLYAYDALDRLTSVTYSPTNNANDPAALTIGYEYDLAGLQTALIYPSGKRVEYGYDNAGKLTSVTEKNAGQSDLLTTYAYDLTTGLLTTTTRPNDTQTINSYDTNGRLIDILHRRTSTQALILEYHYILDAAGRNTQVVVTTPTGVRAEAYVYDDLNRLTQVTYSNEDGIIDPADKVVQYTYDGNGNRLRMTTYPQGIAAGATQTLTYAYGFENRLLSVADQSGVVQEQYFYDWRGNQVMKVTPTGTTRYAYDSRNLLTEVDDGTNHIEYTYDGAGRRVSQSVNGLVTRFVIDPSSAVYQTIEERGATGAVSAGYVYGLDRVSAVLPGQLAPVYYLGDDLRSVGSVTSSTGDDLGEYSYDAFGKVLTGAPGLANPFNFTGQRFDPITGLLDLRARAYDSGSARFTSKDPLPSVTGINQYEYTFSDPVNEQDLTGLAPSLPPGVKAFPGVTLSGVDPTLINALSGIRDIFRDETGNPTWTLWITSGTDSHGSNAPTNVHNNGAALDIGIRVNGTGQLLSDSTVQNIVDDIKAGFPFRVGSGLPYSGKQAQGSDFWDYPTHIHIDTAAGIDVIKGQPQPYYVPPGLKGDFPVNGSFGPVAMNTSVLTDVSFAGDGSGAAIGAIAGGETGLLTPNVGGVLIDQAATLVGSNIKDITGATFDPVSHQLVFLGDSAPATLHDVNLDLFTTAIQSVYGSAAPPFVTLDPSAKLVQQSFNLGNGDGVIPNAGSAPIPINYTPYTPTSADDMALSFDLNGNPVTARIDAQVYDGTNGTGNVTAGGRHIVLLQLGTVAGLPSGVTLTQPTFPITLGGTITATDTITLVGGSGYTLTASAQGQDSNFYFTINNSSGSAVTITSMKLVTDLQQRKFGGRVDNTKLGWIMEEADRVMKELAGGKDQLTNAVYDSHNATLPAGFENTLERYLANNQSGSFRNRFWFTPNYETLKRYIDPVTGEATVVFDQSSVKLNTEALILGQPEDPTARAFADWFNANYDAMANISFPVHDPNDPTGTKVIQEKIFQDLEDAMKAVALARFFHDNNIPLDTWWLNSYTPPPAVIPATIPTLTNSLANGSVTVSFYGGVSIKTPNIYLPDAVAQAINNEVNAQRTPGTGDLGVQAWNVTNTPMGSLNAVAASLDPQKQSADVTLSAADLSFASPGGEQLTFERYYDSGFLGNKNLGLGWQPTRFDLQFQLPSYVDSYGLMRDASGKPLVVAGPTSDTLLRSGEVRLVDHATGQLLNFISSLTTHYSLDNQGNPIMATSGLTSSDVPTFTPGQYQDGSRLAQDPNTYNYTLTKPDASQLVFDPQGNLLTTTDSRGNTITYTYAKGQLAQITDSAGQVLKITYGSDGRIQYVGGPDNSATPQRRIAYLYDTNGRLTGVDTQVLQTGGTYTTARSTIASCAANESFL